MKQPIMLDGFCKAGGSARGYQDAGFYVVGVDKDPQPNYVGDEFIQADAIEYIRKHWRDFDAIHCSPPCQKYTGMRAITLARFGKVGTDHPDLIAPTRRALLKTKVPWLIENVKLSPLIDPVVICGASLGMRHVSRHRLFESNFPLTVPKCACRKEEFTIGVYGERPDGRRVSRKTQRLCRIAKGLAEASELMGIDWMTWDEIKNAIPPTYTRYLGVQLMQYLQNTKGV